MASVVARAEVVVQFGAEGGGDVGVFDEDGVAPVAVADGEGGGRDVLGDPVRVAGASVEGGYGGEVGMEIGDGAGEAVLEEAGGVDGGDDLFGAERARGRWRIGRDRCWSVCRWW